MTTPRGDHVSDDSGRPWLLTLRLLFATIFVVMIVATIMTSLRMSIFDGGPALLRNPWGVMTLLDAYFGFLTFFVWVAWRETTLASRIVWFVLIMTLGNIAMSFYVLMQLARARTDAELPALMRRRTA